MPIRADDEVLIGAKTAVCGCWMKRSVRNPALLACIVHLGSNIEIGKSLLNNGTLLTLCNRI